MCNPLKTKSIIIIIIINLSHANYGADQTEKVKVVPLELIELGKMGAFKS